MIKAVIFDMYETLITQYRSKPYFTAHIAEDAGIEEGAFRKLWYSTEDARTDGITDIKRVVTDIMKGFDCYNPDTVEKIYQSRKASKAEQFYHLHDEIIPLFNELKNRELKVAIISNCYLEEAEVIKESILYSLTDVAVLSSEVGCHKPDEKIYNICLERLGFNADECIYVGDGGCNELYTAKKIGMKSVQACWYLKEWTQNFRQEFEGAESPLEVLNYIN